MTEYCLRWNNHLPTLVNVFSELLQAEGLVDVTLATDGHHIRAHKLVLSACSVYFKELFGHNPCTHPIVFLKDIRYDDLKTVIDFIYKGEVNVTQDRLQDVLKTAESLKIKGLTDRPICTDDPSSLSRGAHLSSSFSSQVSSLTDSREQMASVENDDSPTCSSPAPKKRKIEGQQSTESQHDSGRDSEERSRCNDIKDENRTVDDEKSKADRTKIKQESDINVPDTNTEPESGAVDAMLLLQGSSSETDSGGQGSVTRDPANLLAQSQGSVMCRWGNGVSNSCTIEALLDNPLSSSPTSSTSSSPSLLMMGSAAANTAPQHHPSHLFFAAAAAAAATFNTSTCTPPFFMPYASWHNQFRRMSPNMLLAIDAVRSGRMGFTQAGKTFGVNGRTLWVYYRKLGYEVHNTFRGKRTRHPTQTKVPITATPKLSPKNADETPKRTDRCQGVLPVPNTGACSSNEAVVHPNFDFKTKPNGKACNPFDAKPLSPGIPPSSPSEILSEITPSLSMSTAMPEPNGTCDRSNESFGKNEYNNYSSIVNPSQCRFSGSNPYASQNFMNCIYPMGNNGTCTTSPFDRDMSSSGMPPPASYPEPEAAVLDDDGNSIESLLESCRGKRGVLKRQPGILRDAVSNVDVGSRDSEQNSNLLQVPSVVVGSHDFTSYTPVTSISRQFSKSFLTVTSSGHVVRQHSQPLSSTTGPPPVLKQRSHPSVLTHTTQEKCSKQVSYLHLVPKPTSTLQLRHIQPKPDEYHKKDTPIIQLTTTEEDIIRDMHFGRAVSEEPTVSRPDLLTPSSLVQSLSQDTGMDIAAGPSHKSRLGTVDFLGLTTVSAPHTPSLRDGPSLGCNFCWNTPDNQGKVQRRKTKYHCPDCRTNLCIVPCFHEYHNQKMNKQEDQKQFGKILTKTSSM